MLTDRQIQAALKSGKPETRLNDGSSGKGAGSLYLIVRTNSKGPTALWFAFWKVDGRMRKKQLGRYPDMGLREARQKHAEEVRDVLQAGRNPRVVVAKADAPTVERLFTGYVAGMRSDGKISASEVERALLTGKYAAADHFGRETRAGSIEPADVSAYLAKTYQRGSRVAADRTRSYLSAAFNWGMKATHDYKVENRQDWGIKSNPVQPIKRDESAARSRTRNLSADELGSLWHGFGGPGIDPATVALVRMLICTGQRVRETLRIEGSDIDFQSRLWIMSAEKTKGRTHQHIVPLTDEAIEILHSLTRMYGNGYLFPSRRGKALPHMTDGAVNRALVRWCAANDFERMQTRDLRRTWKSRAADAGIDRFTRDLIQQHAKTDTGSIHYDFADYLPQMRAAMAKWSAWLNSVIQSDAWMKSTLQTIMLSSCSTNK